MKSINEFIAGRIYEDAEADVQKNVVENPAKVTMIDIKPSPLSWQKISKLSAEEFYNIFKDKTLVIYVPVSSVNSFSGGWSGNFADGSKSTRKGTKGSGYFNFGRGEENTIIFITDITETTVNVLGAELRYPIYAPNMGGEMETEKVISQLGSLKNKIFNSNSYQPKTFVVDAPSYKGKKSGEFNQDSFFKPFMNKYDELDKSYNELIGEINKLPTGRNLGDNGASSLRKGATWNYIAFNGSWFDIIVVGYAKAIGLKKEWQSLPVLLTPSSVSTYQIKQRWPNEHSAAPAYKITDKQYQKFEEVIKNGFAKISKLRNEAAKFYNDWLDKFVLGKEINLTTVTQEIDKEIEKQADKKPDETNDPNQGSESVKKTKKAFADAEKKMTAWHEGTRKQNVGACSPEKLKAYYQVCKELGYEKEADQLEAEMKKKGIEIPKLTASLDVDVKEEYLNED